MVELFDCNVTAGLTYTEGLKTVAATNAEELTLGGLRRTLKGFGFPVRYGQLQADLKVIKSQISGSTMPNVVIRETET